MAEVLPAPNPHNGQDYFSSSPLLGSPVSSSPLFLGASPSERAISSPTSPASAPPKSSIRADALRPSQSQPSLRRNSSFIASQPSTLSLNTYIPADDDEEESDEEGLSFPAYYDPNILDTSKPAGAFDHHDEDHEPQSNAPTPDITSPEDAEPLLNPVADDIDVKEQPSRQVDYLSHEWREEDIWSSWRHIVARRRTYGNHSRLENASWRTWTKQKYGLKTVSPETLNWLKDCDVTWLYGPLQEAPKERRNSEPSSQMSKRGSFLNKKPILKKRSVSEEMLQKSISSSSLVKQAAAAVQAQRYGRPHIQSRPTARLRRCASDFDGTTSYTGSTVGTADISSTLPSSTSSGLMSPESNAKRRIRFDNNVEQCIAVDFKEGGLEEEWNPEWMRACSDEESDDDLPTIKAPAKPKPRLSRQNSSRNSFSSESKGIAKLPSTTLKFHHEEPNCRGHPITQWSGPLRSPGISPSPSQETLRPPKHQRYTRGMQYGDDENPEIGSFNSLPKDSISGEPRPNLGSLKKNEEEDLLKHGMRRTPSGMFMPFEEGSDDSLASTGFLNRVVDTVNTAKDIAYVLYNVGWRR